MHSHASSERGTPFDLPSLARALTAADPRFVVWKGGDDLTAQGDLDGAAPRGAWAGLREAFGAWARDQGLTSAVVCTDALGMLILVGLGGEAGERLLQVDLVDDKLVHAVPVWSADDLVRCATLDDGVRRTTPGAEGLARVLAHRRDALGARLVTEDPEGARALADRLGLYGPLALHASAVRRTGLELLLAARAVAAPRRFVGALASDRARRACPVLPALASGRALPEPLDTWLSRVARANHEVTSLA